MPWYVHVVFAFIVFMCGSVTRSAVRSRNFKEALIAVGVALGAIWIYPQMVSAW